jgi:hypothetical protein
MTIGGDRIVLPNVSRLILVQAEGDPKGSQIHANMELCILAGQSRSFGPRRTGRSHVRSRIQFCKDNICYKVVEPKCDIDNFLDRLESIKPTYIAINALRPY